MSVGVHMIALFLLMFAVTPVKLKFASAPLSVAQNSCEPVGMIATSNLGQIAAVSKPTVVAIDQQGNGGVKFFSDSACTKSTKQFLILAGSTSGGFYVSGPNIGTFTIRAQAQGLESVLQSETFTAPPPPPPPPGPPVAPAQATAAGFSKLIFDDEFTSASTINPIGATANNNWYTTGFFGSSANLPASGYSVQNGYLTINTDDSGYSEGMATADPTHTSQVYNHGYFEASIHFDPKGHTSGAWPAFWSYSMANALSQVPSGSQYGEIDFMECYPQGNPCTYITTAHEWTKAVSGGSDSSVQNSNNIPSTNAPSIMKGVDYTQWHTYGLLWTPNQLQWYFDGHLVTTVPTGPGTNYTALETDSMAVILGTGSKWPMDVDWVRIWN